MNFSPLIRRVSIYLVLSTVAVAITNLIGIEQEEAFKIYIPLFITIYILSRWIDVKITRAEDITTMNAKTESINQKRVCKEQETIGAMKSCCSTRSTKDRQNSRCIKRINQG